MQRDASSPEAYRNDVEGNLRIMLESIREIIFQSAPGIDEIIEYGMLGYPGLANLAAQKNYVALYVKPSVLDEHRQAFPGVSCGKSCLRFSRPDQIDGASIRVLLADVLADRAKG